MNSSGKGKITVIGIGKAGTGIVSALVGIEASARLDLAVVDTDKDMLDKCKVPVRILADSGWRNGAGCGGDVIKGQRSIARERSRIGELLKDSSMLIVVGGFGGGTATGGVPIISSVAADKKVPAVFVMTLPFSFEGHSKLRVAEDGVKELLPAADVLLCLPNDLLFSSLEADTPVEHAFLRADEEVAKVVVALSAIMESDKQLSADFSAFRSALNGRKATCCFGTGSASASDGLNRSHLALEKMLASPFMGGTDQLKGAHAVLAVITGGPDMSIGEMKKSLEVVGSFVSDNARIMTGAHIDPAYGDTIQVTAVAVRYDRADIPEITPAKETRFQRNSVNISMERAEPVVPIMAAGADDLFEQGELPLQNISKGIFVNSSACVYNGEDLDIPTFQRKMIKIDKGE